MVWITAAEALTILNVRPQTLYANVSRGKIRAQPDSKDSRRSLYHREDVMRMAKRTNGRRTLEVVAAQAIEWGDPVLPSAISTVIDGRLLVSRAGCGGAFTHGRRWSKSRRCCGSIRRRTFSRRWLLAAAPLVISKVFLRLRQLG
ncbi:Uncharacterised protein [Ewingella americana]|uniref:Helix-turn-helix domain-containing protein n=1 Tax=Ewingella americana TaxID=41202 RepID=A0A377TG23_9GAMM|nr:Uncharacterised protein [Ewingella americana]